MLVRIEQAGRTAARAVLAENAAEAAAATEERRKSRERAAKRATATTQARKKRAAESDADEAVETLADAGRVHASTGPAAVAEADEDAARPRGRRRSRAKAPEGASNGVEKEDAPSPGADEGAAQDGD